MPVLTPAPYRQMYQIYPGKACIDEDATQCNTCLRARIESLGRTVGTGPGGRFTRTASQRGEAPRVAQPSSTGQLSRSQPRFTPQKESSSPLVVLR
jgi:hypothetical protein